MKRCVGTAVCFALFSCAPSGDNAGTESSVAEADAAAQNTEVVIALYEAFASNDGETIGQLVTDDVVWIEAPNTPYADNSPYVGKEAVFGDLFVKLGTEWTGYTVTPETFVAERDTVITLGNYTGVYNATEGELAAQFVHVWTIEDGKIAQFQQFTDTAHFTQITSASE